MTTNDQDRAAQAEAEAAGEGTWVQRQAADPVTEGVRPEERGHGDGTVEQRPDQLTGPGGVQREREELGTYDPTGVQGNPSDPADYPNPDEQRAGTSRTEPKLDQG